jgi:hypothetical protein
MQLTGCLKHSSLQFPADFDEAWMCYTVMSLPDDHTVIRGN